jgi:ABC-2 type transport system permease protein
MLPAWVYILAITAAEVAFSLKALFPTAAKRDALVASVAGNPALSFLYGQLHGTSVGALTAWRYLAYSALGAGLMSIFLVIRHTRADEQAGRLELARSAAVGRHAALTAALVVAVAANLAVIVLLAAVSIVLGMPAAGAVAYAAAAGGCGLAFAAVAAVTAQLSGSPRAARGMAIAVLGAAFVLRGIGDSAGARGPEWLTWLSPVGWAEEARPFAGDRWAALAPMAAVAVGLGALAYWLATRRDLGDGLFPPRPGSPVAGRLLRGPGGLAWRLQRGSLAGWALGLFATGIAIGAAGKGIGSLIGTSSALRQAFERIGGQSALTTAYLAAIMSLSGLAAAGYAAGAALRLHGEEDARLAEAVLTTPTGRLRWAASHLLVTVAGTAVVLAAAGAGAGLGYGLRAGDPGGWVARLIGAGLAQLPAALVLAGLAAAVFGLLPRLAVPVTYTVLGLAALLAILGPSVKLPGWVTGATPFSHVPRLPGAPLTAAPLIWLSVAALGLAVIGLAALRRRDLG